MPSEQVRELIDRIKGACLQGARASKADIMALLDLDSAGLKSGANSVVVEMGANPRDTDFNDAVWLDVSAAEGHRALQEAGFEVRLCDCDPRFREGESWWVPSKTVSTEEVPRQDDDGPYMNCCGKRVPLTLARQS